MLIMTSCLLSLTQTPVVTLNRTFYIFKMRINDLCNMFRIHFVIVFVWICPSMVYAYGLQVHLCKAQVNGSNTVLCTTGTMYIVHTPLVCFQCIFRLVLWILMQNPKNTNHGSKCSSHNSIRLLQNKNQHDGMPFLKLDQSWNVVLWFKSLEF